MKNWLLILTLLSPSTLAESLSLQLLDQRGRPLADVVVMLFSDSMPAVQPRQEIVNQIDETFVPRVSVMPVGSQVNFPNQDQILHHVYSFSDTKTFEVPLYAGTPALPVTFDQPGLVILGCNIHDWMQAWVMVTDSPWAGKTDADGRLVLEDLPVDTYRLEIWHPNQRRGRPPEDLVISGAATREIALEVRPAITLRSIPGGDGDYF